MESFTVLSNFTSLIPSTANSCPSLQSESIMGIIKRISLRLLYEVTSIAFSDAIYLKRKHLSIVKPVSERQALAEFNVENKTFLSKIILFINVKFKCIQSKKNVLFYQGNSCRSRYYRLPSQTICFYTHYLFV